MREDLVVEPGLGVPSVVEPDQDLPLPDKPLLAERVSALEARLREIGSVVVAFSGGADSAFLLAAAA
ncbi:MAG: hypothetical protein H0U28_12360, partial [Nocardioidaceae bacterium]|nr:hypothetical protein [Nocardioidaceae bacterium]